MITAVHRWRQWVATQHAQLQRRAIELLGLPPNDVCLLLDVGGGVGDRPSRDEMWIHTELEISKTPAYFNDGDERVSQSLGGNVDEEATLHTSTQFRFNVLRNDMGDGIPFRPGCFDGAISIAVLQRLCNADHKGHIPQRRLKAFFHSLYGCLRPGARAVLQFYPENAEQVEMITRGAMLCGFSGGLVIDFPHSAEAKKMYLVLHAGPTPKSWVPPVPLMTSVEPQTPLSC